MQQLASRMDILGARNVARLYEAVAHVQLVRRQFDWDLLLARVKGFVGKVPAARTDARIQELLQVLSAAAHPDSTAPDSTTATQLRERAQWEAFAEAGRELRSIVSRITVRCDPRTDPRLACRVRLEELLRAIEDLGSVRSGPESERAVLRVANLVAAIPEVRSHRRVQALLEELRAASSRPVIDAPER
ncbi:MAG: hypothetical protein ACRDJ9_21920 [Dehalococcoidia bacterium]